MSDDQEPQLVSRFHWKIEEYNTAYDDDIGEADQVCIDRLTGLEVVRYDLGDPANYAPSHGGWSKREYLERKGFDPDEEIAVKDSVVPVSAYEVSSHMAGRQREQEREEEYARGGDLHLHFPDLECEGNGYCNNDPREGNGKTYLHWESDVATAAMQAAGYTDVLFYDIERDSFGPLIRGVRATGPDGKVVRFSYG